MTKELTLQDKALIIRRWRRSVTDFLKDCFPHHYTKDFAPFHKEIYEILTSHNRIAIAAPRGHGKSEIISFGFVIWNLLCNPDNHFTIIISNNYANACKYLAPIKDEIENNKTIKAVFGELKSDKWSENEAEFTHRKKITVGGNEFKIRGQKYYEHRPDLIIIDDAEDDELVRSDSRRENFEHWLLYSLEPAMTHTDKDKIIMVGTILHRASQLSKLMGDEGKYRNWFSKLYKALDDGKALWPQNISTKWLEDEKEKDPYKFAQEYLNNPVPFEHAMFKEEYFDNYEDKDLPKDLIVNITCDLACTDKSYSDYTVILPCGVDAYGDLWVLPYFRGKYSDPDKIIEQLFSECAKYEGKDGWSLGRVGIEKVAFQRFLVKNFDRERKKRGKHFPVDALDAKGDKVTRISQLQPLFSAGDIHIRQTMLDLKQELLDFPRALHDDIADALAMQLSYLGNKPVVKKEKPLVRFHVTPEIQRKKIMRKRAEAKSPKVMIKGRW